MDGVTGIECSNCEYEAYAKAMKKSHAKMKKES